MLNLTGTKLTYICLLMFQGPTAAYYQQYNFEIEPWWPKFDRLRNKFGITIIKGDKAHQGRGEGVKKNANSRQINSVRPPQPTSPPNSQSDRSTTGFNYMSGLPGEQLK